MIFASTSGWRRTKKWMRSRCAGRTARPKLSTMFRRTSFTRLWKARESRIRLGCRRWTQFSRPRKLNNRSPERFGTLALQFRARNDMKKNVRLRRESVASAVLAAGIGWAMTGMSAPLCCAQANSSAAQPKMTEQAFKNIQVLKGLPADQLIPSMQFISASLGVECDYCHVESAFDKDDKKPKPIARKMIQMMFAINQDNFEGRREVTCNSCHRGSPHPADTPAIGGEAARLTQPDHAPAS